MPDSIRTQLAQKLIITGGSRILIIESASALIIGQMIIMLRYIYQALAKRPAHGKGDLYLPFLPECYAKIYIQR